MYPYNSYEAHHNMVPFVHSQSQRGMKRHRPVLSPVFPVQLEKQKKKMSLVIGETAPPVGHFPCSDIHTYTDRHTQSCMMEWLHHSESTYAFKHNEGSSVTSKVSYCELVVPKYSLLLLLLYLLSSIECLFGCYQCSYWFMWLECCAGVSVLHTCTRTVYVHALASQEI